MITDIDARLRLASKGMWAEVMKPGSEELERQLCKLQVVSWSSCPACEVLYPNSISAHICGQKHWKQVGNRLGWTLPTDASDWEQSWHSEKGCISFNHVTGEFTMRSEPEIDAQTTTPPASSDSETSDSAGRFSLLCTSCGLEQACEAFSKKNRKMTLLQRRCKDCVEKQRAEDALIICSSCKQRLERSAFRRHVNWDQPACCACLEREEFDTSLKLQEDAYCTQIISRAKAAMGEIPASLYVVRCGTRNGLDNLLIEERFTWGSRLSECVQKAMDNGHLPSWWSQETPSRDHAGNDALAKAAANQFKGLEDAGDKLIQDDASHLFLRFVAGERISICTLEDLLNSIQLGDANRCAWTLPRKKAVVAAVRPLQGWTAHDCESEDLRAEPHSGALRPSLDGFAQFTSEVASSLRRILPGTTRLELKLYDEEFWRVVEKHLYNGNDAVGSHNQTLRKIFGLAGGAAAGANRTEVMCLFADLLGFHDPDKSKSTYWSHQVWAEHFGHLLPPRLLVSYGSGQAFRMDSLWQQKMQANVAEALVGALDAAGLAHLVKAAACICLLSYLAPVAGVLPSNWAMAKKTIDLFEAGFTSEIDWMQQHFDTNALKEYMASLLI